MTASRFKAISSNAGSLKKPGFPPKSLQERIRQLFFGHRVSIIDDCDLPYASARLVAGGKIVTQSLPDPGVPANQQSNRFEVRAFPLPDGRQNRKSGVIPRQIGTATAGTSHHMPLQDSTRFPAQQTLGESPRRIPASPTPSGPTLRIRLERNVREAQTANETFHTGRHDRGMWTRATSCWARNKRE